ncbi:MAG TPA: NADH-dependent [FeFe] hydrogenase, group A6 [Bacillota bacterium]|nr:NADH-dependent [FeFe] hydrogenase, group A6 [Bacillota bacterium]HPU75417.1 NADH-dependent [FeFe] hydrogenase, group A6 [Bacillota bacterium]
MGDVTLTIDGRQVTVPAGTSVLEAATQAGVKIPTLCYLEGLNEIGSCRLCVVEIEGAKTLAASCVTPAAQGMVVHTNTRQVREARRAVLELIISNHPFDCLTCVRSGSCELQALAESLGIREIRFAGAKAHHAVDNSTPSIVRDPDKCILCRRCVAVCEQVQGVSAINVSGRGFNSVVSPAGQLPLGDAACTLCGQCILVCPTGALSEVDSTRKVWEALGDAKKHVVVQTAPAIRVALGEEFGLAPGSIVTGQLVAGLRALGFDRVFDTNFTADLTILEEGNELLQRLTTGGTLPMITSCSPGWIKFIEHFYPDMLGNLSTCKSPQQMFGALAKTYYAEKAGVDPADMFVVSIMPCTAKKFECERPEMRSSGYQDVDAVLTTRELARMLREAGIDPTTLEPEDYDAPLGIGTGAAVIFGATGGVMEAALRTVYEVVMKQDLPSLDFREVRGFEGIKEAEVVLGDTTVRVAVAHTLGNARKLLERVRSGEAFYHFIEIMACPGGCIGGGGQPIGTNTERRLERIDAIYQADRDLPLRKSHDNPEVKQLYEEFLGEPLGHRSHELLHTQYTARGVWPKR